MKKLWRKKWKNLIIFKITIMMDAIRMKKRSMKIIKKREMMK
jgi:hypothetical protein